MSSVLLLIYCISCCGNCLREGKGRGVGVYVMGGRGGREAGCGEWASVLGGMGGNERCGRGRCIGGDEGEGVQCMGTS